MLNTKKIVDTIRIKNLKKVWLCSQAGIARTTLEAILNGGDTQVSTLEAIAKALDVPIGYLFDDPITSVHTEGDYSPASDSGDVSVVIGDAVMAERVKALEKLIAEKDERISELKERIEELKGK